MLNINGSKFAKNEAEFKESIFHSGGTCKGYYKKCQNDIKLYNMQKKEIGAINKHGILCLTFFIEINGKLKKYYQFAFDRIAELKDFTDCGSLENFIKLYEV